MPTSGNKSTITVLIVDDHDLIRMGIRSLLLDAKDIKVVAEAGSGEAALELVRELSPDVVLMDIKMPGIGGFEATRKILRFRPETKILIITACTDDVHPSHFLKIGALGYITKEARIDEMMLAIHTIYKGQQYVTPKVAQQMVLNKVHDGDKTPFDDLSSRELQVAFMIIKGYKAPEISEKLNLSSKTVNTYRYRIFKKLKVKGDVELVHLSMQHDLLVDE